jgi:hypothetical protein
MSVKSIPVPLGQIPQTVALQFDFCGPDSDPNSGVLPDFGHIHISIISFLAAYPLVLKKEQWRIPSSRTSTDSTLR